MISRDLVEWFVERALEYQTLLPEDCKHDIRFEIIKRGFIVTIWSKEEDEDGGPDEDGDADEDVEGHVWGVDIVASEDDEWEEAGN